MWLLYNINGLLVTNTLHILTVAYHLRGFTLQHSLLSTFLDETVCDLFKDCRGYPEEAVDSCGCCMW